MRIVTVSEAAANFASLMTDVERGETIVITRQGKKIGKITGAERNDAPSAEAAADDLQKRQAAVQAIREFRANNPLDLTIEEILSARHEGHRY